MYKFSPFNQNFVKFIWCFKYISW